MSRSKIRCHHTIGYSSVHLDATSDKEGPLIERFTFFWPASERKNWDTLAIFSCTLFILFKDLVSTWQAMRGENPLSFSPVTTKLRREGQQIQPRHNAAWAYLLHPPFYFMFLMLVSPRVSPRRVIFYSMRNPSRLPRRRSMTATHDHDKERRSATTLRTTILTHWQPLPPTDDDNDSFNPKNERQWSFASCFELWWPFALTTTISLLEMRRWSFVPTTTTAPSPVWVSKIHEGGDGSSCPSLKVSAFNLWCILLLLSMDRAVVPRDNSVTNLTTSADAHFQALPPFITTPQNHQYWRQETSLSYPFSLAVLLWLEKLLSSCHIYTWRMCAY